jgi:DNA-binding IclR family transcriptional regulator
VIDRRMTWLSELAAMLGLTEPQAFNLAATISSHGLSMQSAGRYVQSADLSAWQEAARRQHHPDGDYLLEAPEAASVGGFQ